MCQHRWLIETATDKTSKGICAECSAEREFLNYIYLPYGSLNESYLTSGHPQRLQKPTMQNRMMVAARYSND